MNHGVGRIRGGFPLSMRLIREIHAVLLEKGRGSARQPGEFRRSQNRIGGTRPGNALFVPPPPDRIPDLMSDLKAFIHADTPEMPALVKAGLVHVRFGTIHPFLDGNGRLGRLLIAFPLCAQGILNEPILYLGLYFKTHRRRRCDLLQQARERGDRETWLEFVLEGVAETSLRASEAAQLHVGDMRRMPPPDMEPDVVGGEGGEPRGGIAARRARGLPRGGQPPHVFPHQREQQFLLVGEIAVESGGLHADLGGEKAHRHRLEPAPGDQPHRRLAYRVLRLFAVRSDGSGHDSPPAAMSIRNNKTNVRLNQGAIAGAATGRLSFRSTAGPRFGGRFGSGVRR